MVNYPILTPMIDSYILTCLTLWILGKFRVFLPSADFFSNLSFHVFNSLDPAAEPDLGPICLQRLSASDKDVHRARQQIHILIVFYAFHPKISMNY